MRKLFKAIRDYDLQEVKAILENNPKEINSISVPTPKKDRGQSPLQVAIKITAFDIAEYLIEHYSDVNFMEEKYDETSLRCPVLHDAIGAVMFCLCCSPLCSKEEIIKHIDNAGKAFLIFKMLCEKGADVNKTDSIGFNAMSRCVFRAESVLDHQETYPFTQKETEKFFTAMLDVLIEHGADFADWANSDLNKERYINNFVPKDDRVIETNFRGKVETIVQKGNVDFTAHTRAVIQKYIKDRNIII